MPTGELPSTTFLFVRHAQMVRGVPDGGLSPLGERQANALAEHLRALAVDHVLTSPANRSLETARAFTGEFEVDDRLLEFDFTDTWLVSHEPDERDDLQFWLAEHGPPGGDTLGAFQARVSATCDDLARAHLGRCIVVVSHAGFIDAALRWAYDLPPEAPWLTESDLRNATITEIEHWPEGRLPGAAPRFWLVKRTADAAHLTSDLLTDI